MCDCSYRALVRELHREEHPAVGRGLEVVVRDDVRARPGRRDARQQLALLLPLRRGARTRTTILANFDVLASFSMGFLCYFLCREKYTNSRAVVAPHLDVVDLLHRAGTAVLQLAFPDLVQP
jgi:hypothetical protein